MTRYGLVLVYVAAAFVIAGGSQPRAFTSAGGAAQAAPAVKIEEWTVPTPKSHPHDPAVAPDGSAWYTGQRSNTLGRLDPRTGAFKEYPLPVADSGPHGIVSDKDGYIWFTANSAAYIGRLDPKTGEVKQFKMPDPKARDPHTPIFDKHGTLWFTVQGGNFVGRLNPITGAIDLKTTPTSGSRPYGIVVNSKGVPFFDLFGTNKIGSIDPASLEIREYPLPEGARPRRIEVGGDDIIWYTDYARGYLGRLDPATGAVEEFPSPGGPQSRPYGIAIPANGMIWYSESAVEPNTIVRFDPGTRKFQSWPIPSGGGIVRHMVAARDGTLWLACSGVDRIARVTIK
jgi:virginiamycin B lyase